MTTTRHSPPADRPVPAGTAEHESDQLDEALDESFPASDPVAVSITAIEPRTSAPPAAREAGAFKADAFKSGSL